MFTRTVVKAFVVYDLYAKDENGKVVVDTKETTLAGCASEDKANIILAKEHKGALVNIQSIEFTKDTYAISEEVFFEHATILDK